MPVTPAARRTAHAGVVAALVYAGFGAFGWAATWGTVALALVAAALLLALVEPWGRRLRRRPLIVAAWLGAAVLAVPGFPGVVESLLILAGALDGHDNGMAEWVFLVTYGAFSVLSVALAVSAQRPRASASAARWAGRAAS
jgi:hypothetical protein